MQEAAPDLGSKHDKLADLPPSLMGFTILPLGNGHDATLNPMLVTLQITRMARMRAQP